MSEMNPATAMEGSYPYYSLSDRVIYITRGFRAEADGTGLTLADWLDTLEQMDELIPDERCEIRNPHTEKTEVWNERGRARCVSSSGQPGWFSFMPRHISATVAKKLPSVRLIDRFEKILKTVGRNPSLDAWRDYVKKNRYLRLSETAAVGGKAVCFPGRAVTLAKSGGIIAFRPSAIFIYYGPSPLTRDTPDPVFLAVAQKAARLLRAKVNTKGFL
jgi:hypothetical protein